MQGEATESFQEDYSSRSSEEEKSPEDPLPTRSHITVEGLEKPNWREAYAKCAWWQDMYMATQNTGDESSSDWPKGFQMGNEQLFYEGKLCVPLEFQGAFIRLWHAQTGHVGADRLWERLQHTTEWADIEQAHARVKRVGFECETCQACNRPHRLKTKVAYSPMPPKLMVSVALDISECQK